MKSILTLTATLCFVLLSFTIATAQKIASPKPTPTPALTDVAHDSTLTGNGTTASPLGVADAGVGTAKIANDAVTTTKIADGGVTNGKIGNGAVTATKLADGSVAASKLGTANAPAAGQVLTFNGTGLTWSTAAMSLGPLRVVDSLGNEVGIVTQFLDEEADTVRVLRYVPADETWVLLRVRPGGFVVISGDEFGTQYFESPDCTGTSYVGRGTNVFNVSGVVFQGAIYYGSGVEAVQRTFQSQRNGPVAQCFSTAETFPSVPWVSSPIPAMAPPFKLAR